MSVKIYPMPSKVIFLDANILLHFRPIHEICWNDVVGACSVTLVISQPVLDDLDAVKDSPNQVLHMRRRARTVLA